MAKIETVLSPAQVAIAEAVFAGSYGVTLGKREGNPTSIPVPMADMPAAAWLKIVTYGVQRTFNDAVGGSDTLLADKVKAAREMVTDFLAGKVGRQASARVSPLEVAIRNVLRGLVVAKMDKAAKTAWDALEAEDRNDQLDTRFAALPDDTKAKITAKAQADVDAAIARAAAAKALADEVNIDL